MGPSVVAIISWLSFSSLPLFCSFLAHATQYPFIIVDSFFPYAQLFACCVVFERSSSMKSQKYFLHSLHLVAGDRGRPLFRVMLLAAAHHQYWPDILFPTRGVLAVLMPLRLAKPRHFERAGVLGYWLEHWCVYTALQALEDALVVQG